MAIPKLKMPKAPQKPMAGYTTPIGGLMRGGPGIGGTSGGAGLTVPSFRFRTRSGIDQTSYKDDQNPLAFDTKNDQAF